MSESDFIGYVGPHDIHDGRIVAVNRVSGRLAVEIESSVGAKIVVTFSEVTNVIAQEAVGMMLYSLTEMKGNGSTRRFCFANWDDESQASLEVEAANFTWEVTYDA